MSNTAMIGNIQVIDSNFNPVTNFTMIGSTGTNYAALVPEPTSGSLLLAGAVVPMLRWKRGTGRNKGAGKIKAT